MDEEVKKSTPEDVMEAMDAILAIVPRVKITESRFVSKYLGLFVSLEETKFPKEVWERGNIIWQREVAKNPYAPVDIIANVNGTDVVKFTIPPILNNETEVFDRVPGFNISEQVSAASDKAAVLEIQGVKHLTEHVYPFLAENKPRKDYLDTWNSILTHYGYSPLSDDIPVNSIVDGEKSVVSKLTESDGFEIDDL